MKVNTKRSLSVKRVGSFHYNISAPTVLFAILIGYAYIGQLTRDKISFGK